MTHFGGRVGLGQISVPFGNNGKVLGVVDGFVVPVDPTGGGGGTGTLDTELGTFDSNSGTITADLTSARWFAVTPAGNIALAFSNVPAGVGVVVTVEVNQDSTVRTVAPPAGTTWSEGGPPLQVASKWCLITLATTDGGASWKATGVVQE